MSQSNTYPGFFTKTSLIQLGYGIWANLTTMTIGLAYGFPSIQIPQLNDPGSKFTVSMEEASWIASILSLFCPIGCVLSGILMDKYGRSIMIMVCHLPMCVGWIYTVMATSAVHMIIARAILGMGCGMAMGPPRLYTSEISLPNMRGLLGGTPNVFLSLGITLQAALGLVFPWTNLCYISGAFNITLFFSYYFLTETPYYMLLRETPAHAMKALAAFRAKDYNLGMEINQLIEFKQNNNIRSLNYSQKLNEMFSRSACKPFGIIITFITFGCLTGCPIVTFWTIELLKIENSFLLGELAFWLELQLAFLFQATNSSFDVYEGNFYVAFTRLIFGVVAFVLLFKTPRKTMALISVSGVSLTWLAFGAYLHQDPGPSLVPQMFLMIFTAFACLSFYVLPFLLMSELYPLQIRGSLTGISIAITNIELFLTAKCFPVLRDGLGVPNVVLMFSASAFFCYIFLFLLLPETKGLTLQEIEEYFKNRRASPATVRQLSSLHQFGEKSRKSNLNDMVENAGRHKRRREHTGGNRSLGPPSITSRESKKSVSLLMGKQFKDMTKHEEMEMNSTVDNSTERKLSSSSDESSTSNDAKRLKKEKDAKK